MHPKDIWYTYGLENESILVNGQGIPQYLTQWEKTANMIIKIFQQRHPMLKNMIKPELDACQIELINELPHTTLVSATQEIAECLFYLDTILKEFWLEIAKDVAPITYWPYITSDALYWDITERYKNIWQKLTSLWVRASTNIAWLHVNIWHKDNTQVLKLHKKISEKIYDILLQWKLPIDTNPERFRKYIEVTNTIGENYFPIVADEYTSYLDKQWNPIVQWHTLVRLKKYEHQLVSEIRTPDAGTSPDDIYKKVQNQSDFLSTLV